MNDAHTLIWEGRPYIPVGCVFIAQSVAPSASADAYQADVKALETLKSKGITHVILKGTVPATAADPSTWQKIIDYLDANGFTYGMEPNDGPKEPLRGYLISPNRYRLEGPTTETTISCSAPDVDSAIYLVVNRIDDSVETTGGAVVRDGKMSVKLGAPLSAGQILIVYPHKSYKSVADGGIGDIWSGFAEYRDRTMEYFKKIKFGPGMWFFIEPFTSKMDFTDEMVGLVPDSVGFRLGFEAYLTKMYVHEGAVTTAWSLTDNLNSLETAARLIPLWSAGRGIPYAYDRASAQLYSVDTTTTQLWPDMIKYRDASAQEYMNIIADTLKKNVVDVPVVFNASSYHRIYANPFGLGGFDGLGADVYGTGDTPVTKVAGPAYSLAEESAKSMWDITSGTQDTTKNWSNETTALASLDTLREIGCKGFFVDSSAVTNDQIDWLKHFKDQVKSSAYTDFKPTVVSYPVIPQTGGYVRRLGHDAWWLPSLKAGEISYIGDGLSAYTILGEDKAYLWSSIGPKTITVKIGPTGYPSVEFPDKSPLVKQKNGLFELTLTDSPVVLRGMDFNLVFPKETAAQEIDKLAQLIPVADKANLDVKSARSGFANAKTVLANGQAMIAFGIAETSLKDLASGLGMDVWLEGEKSSGYSFDGPVVMPGASGNLVLALDRSDDPPFAPYTASYVFDTQSNSSYEIWIACTGPEDSSPVSYSMDGGSWASVNADAKTPDYAPGLAWYKSAEPIFFPAHMY